MALWSPSKTKYLLWSKVAGFQRSEVWHCPQLPLIWRCSVSTGALWQDWQLLPYRGCQPRMLERRRLPGLPGVALAAADGEIAVDVVGRRGVAGLARLAHVCLQQGVGESLAADLYQLRSLVIAVAGHAVLLDQLLVERRLHLRLRDRHALGRAQTDVGKGMAGDASRRRRTAQGRMAGEAVRLQLGMRGQERPRCHHLVRIDEDEHKQCDQVGRDHGQQPAALHRQPQNRKMLRMCAVARTANASVIG